MPIFATLAPVSALCARLLRPSATRRQRSARFPAPKVFGPVVQWIE